jgi:hypothetical protein
MQAAGIDVVYQKGKAKQEKTLYEIEQWSKPMVQTRK